MEPALQSLSAETNSLNVSSAKHEDCEFHFDVHGAQMALILLILVLRCELWFVSRLYYQTYLITFPTLQTKFDLSTIYRGF